MSVMEKYEAIPQLDPAGDHICMGKLTSQMDKCFLLKASSTKITLPAAVRMLLGIGQVALLRLHFLGFVHNRVILSVRESRVLDAGTICILRVREEEEACPRFKRCMSVKGGD